MELLGVKERHMWISKVLLIRIVDKLYLSWNIDAQLPRPENV